MLVNGLQFAAGERHQTEMKVRLKWRSQLPAGGVRELRPPKLFGHRRLWRARRNIQPDESFQRQRRNPQCLRQAKRERAAGKHFASGIARDVCIRRRKMQFNFMQHALRIPKRGRAGFGDDFQPVMPGAFAERAKRAETLFVKLQQLAGFMTGSLQFHFKKRSRLSPVHFIN